MVLVDSSVWIDFFNGVDSGGANLLDSLLKNETVIIGDLILAEVLQGLRSDRDYRLARRLLTSLDVRDLLGREMAVRVADNYRKLRKSGYTVRKTVDLVIATYCIEHTIPLLHSDRDFESLSEFLGLVSIEAAC
jgi:predicted nucleic acid-binding protein